MRDLTKSLTSFSWAMSLLGAQQLLSLTGRPAAASLGDVQRVTEGQLDGYLRDVFEAGDQVQRSAVDLAYGVITLEALNPNRFAALSAEMVRQSTSALWRLLPGGGRLASSNPSSKTETASSRGCRPCDWGPMPPAR